MKQFFLRTETLLFFVFALLLLFVYRQYFFGHKILFPSNLLVSAYAPWKYEPVPEYPRGPPNKPIGFDDIRQFFPNRKLLSESLSKGVIPLWNPYIYSGTPFMAAFDTAVWYPLSWIAAFLPAVAGWNFLVIIQPILSLLFMYLFLRSMKFDRLIAAYGAFVWAFAGFMVVYSQEILVLAHSFLWLPLAMYGSNRLWSDQTDKWGFVLMILALSSSVFGGFLQMSIYVYAVVFAWNLFLSLTNRKIHIRVYAAMILSALVAFVQIIPSAEAFLMSPRGASEGITTFRSALLPIWHMITLIAPDFWGNTATYTYFGGPGFYFEKMIFIGVIPLILAVYAVWERKNKQILFWVGTAVVALSMGFAVPTSWLPNILHIPVLANSYPTRIFGVWTFAATILSCFGLSHFLRKADYKRLIYIAAGLTVMLIAGWIVSLSAWCVSHNYPPGAVWCMGKTSVLWDIVGHIPGIFSKKDLYGTVSLRNLLLPTIFICVGWALIAVKKLSAKMTLIIIFGATIASGLYFAGKYIYFSEQRFVYPDLPVTREISSVARYDRVWGYGDAFIEKNLPQYFPWFSTDGYGNLSSNRYAELLSTIGNNGRLGDVIRRSDTDIFEASERDSMSSNPFRLRMMSLLGVKYVLELNTSDSSDKRPERDRFPPSLFTPVWQNEKWTLWRFSRAQPRVVYATNYLVKETPQDIVDALYDPHTELTNTVILEKDPGVVLSVTQASGSAYITSYGLNTVKVRTDSGSDGFLLLTDNYYPGWVVSVDGKRKELYRADYAFKSVFVPKGTHTVVFQYAPQSFIIGGAATLVGFIAAAFIL